VTERVQTTKQPVVLSSALNHRSRKTSITSRGGGGHLIACERRCLYFIRCRRTNRGGPNGGKGEKVKYLAKSQVRRREEGERGSHEVGKKKGAGNLDENRKEQ